MAGKNSILMKVLSWLLIFSLINTTAGCNYYTYKSDAAPSIEKLDKLKNSPNYIIVHQADQAFNLTNVRVDQQAQTISGVLTALSPDHKKYLETKSFPGSANRYKKKGKDASPFVVNEVHFYVKELALSEGESIMLTPSSLEKVEVYDPDTGATVASHIFGGVGIVAGVYVLIIIIILLTKSSCPFVFVNNGEEFVFAGEIYSGAIFESIERDDYLMLPNIMSDNLLEIKVANKLKEQQFINQLEVMQVSHPVGTVVLPDRHGNVHLIKNPVTMTKAMVDDLDITTLLQRHDSTQFTFNAETGDDYFNDVVLTFPKPSVTKEGHLVMHTKNSLWGDYLFGEFTKLFGSRYSSWIEKQNKKPTEETSTWAVDQGLAMKVYVEVNNTWKFVDIVDLVGPLAFRDLVVPIDLSAQQGETVRVKLSSGFMMWDLDYVVMDYSSDSGVGVTYIEPAQAVTRDGDDVLTSLKATDANHLAQKTTGDEVMVSFPLYKPVAEGIAYDYILHSRGYYQHVRDYEGSPEISTLLSFKLQARFSRFSKEKYDEINQLLSVAEISASKKK